jgi:type I restriction enzyme S subunit
LAELTDNFDGVRVPVKEADRRAGSYPYYGASGIVDHVDRYLFDGDYLLIAEDGENLRTRNTPVAFLARGKFWVNNHAHIVRGNSEADTRFLMYALSSADISGYLTGSTMPKLTQGNLNRIPLLTPPLPEQRAIAHILGTLDDKIELNRRMNETLEAMARALFKSWFVDFDPVRAKAEGRAPGLPPHLAALFPDRFQESELGEVPEGWEVRTISDLADINARTLSKSDQLDTIEYVEISEVSRGDIANTKLFARGDEPSRARRRLAHGDSALSTVRPERGAYFLALQPSPSLIASTGFAVVSPRTAPWSFIHAALTLPEVYEHLGHLADGGAYPAVHPDVIGAIDVAWPEPSGVVEQFHALCAPLYEHAASNRKESRTLTATRNALLPKLVSGEVRVEEAVQVFPTDGRSTG